MKLSEEADADVPRYVLQCKACRTYMGRISHRRAAFCKDKACQTVRAWVLPHQDMTDLVVFLRDVKDIPLIKIGEMLGIGRVKASSLYHNHKSRKIYTVL